MASWISKAGFIGLAAAMTSFGQPVRAAKGGASDVPSPDYVSTGDARYFVWDKPIKVPGMGALLAQFENAQKECRVAHVGCEHAERSCSLGLASCEDPDHACQHRAALCANVPKACRPLRDAPACPGYTPATDPGQKLLRSATIASLIDLDGGVSLRFAGVDRAGHNAYVTYQHHVAAEVNGVVEWLPVVGSKIVLEASGQGALVHGLTSHLAVGFSPANGVLISPASAILAAAAHFEEAGTPVSLDLVTLDHVRVVAVRVRERQAASDHIAYAIDFPRGLGVAGSEALVGAEDGRVLYSKHQGPLSFEPIFVPAQAFLPDTFFDFALCQLADGQGNDRFGKSRFFSTSSLQKGDLIGIRTFGTTSCPELGTPLSQDDVVTFQMGPSQTVIQTSKVGSSNVYTSDNNVFMDASVVETQHWGEVVLAYLDKLGIKQRKTTAFKDGAPLRLRALMAPNALNEATAAWYPPTLNPAVAPFSTVLQEGNGQVLFGKGDGTTTRSWSAPSVIAHELFHSVLWDHPEDGGKSAVKHSEWLALREGLTECFEMLFVAAHKSKMSFDQVPPDPFHLASDVFIDIEDATKGNPNLADPRQSASGERAAWVGAAPAASWVNPHPNATLISGACRLLVKGGHNPDAVYKTWAVTPGQAATHALGWPANQGPVDEAAGFARLESLLVQTVIGGKLTAASDVHGLIDAMAAQAASSSQQEKWGMTSFDAAERVRRAFAAMGWGRGVEHDQNSAGDVESWATSGAASRNRIGAGNTYSRPIKGSACCSDQDFFILGERVPAGKVLSWTLPQAVSAGLRLRVYVDKPCAFPPPNATQDLCAKDHQIFPPVNASGLAKEETAATGGDVAIPGTGRRVVFIGIAPMALSPGGDYTLTVKVPQKVYD